MSLIINDVCLVLRLLLSSIDQLFHRGDHQAMRPPFLFGAGFAIVGALALWSCGGASAPAAPSPAPAPAPTPSSVTVDIVGSIGNQAYRPNPVSANSGDTLWFRNNDSAMHHNRARRWVRRSRRHHSWRNQPGLETPEHERDELPLHPAPVDGGQHQRREGAGPGTLSRSVRLWLFVKTDG